MDINIAYQNIEYENNISDYDHNSFNPTEYPPIFQENNCYIPNEQLHINPENQYSYPITYPNYENNSNNVIEYPSFTQESIHTNTSNNPIINTEINPDQTENFHLIASDKNYHI